jgi:hypothetical protein
MTNGFVLHGYVKCLTLMCWADITTRVSLNGLSHEIFGPGFWPVWMYLGLNVNRLRFLYFNDAALILDN